MKTRSSILKIFLVLTLSLSAFAAMPASTASASASDERAIWNGCKASIIGYGLNNKGQAWSMMKIGNPACRQMLTTYYTSKSGVFHGESTITWYGKQTIGFTTNFAIKKGSKVTFHFYANAGAFGSTRRTISYYP